MDIKVNKNTIVVFDLDDTLYNELDYLKSAYKSIAKHLEPINWRALYSSMFSLHRCNMNVFEQVANKYKTNTLTLVQMYREHKPDIVLFEGVLDLFKAIKTNNGSIGILTDGRSHTQRAKLESLNILDFIDKIIISEEIGSEKPSILNYRAIEDDFVGFQYYYIADNLKKDFVTPNFLGWKTIGLIDNGKNIHCKSHNYMNIEHRPQEFIFSFNEINII
jgi:putative hydrolase of the HAD superfamily